MTIPRCECSVWSVESRLLAICHRVSCSAVSSLNNCTVPRIEPSGAPEEVESARSQEPAVLAYEARRPRPRGIAPSCKLATNGQLSDPMGGTLRRRDPSHPRDSVDLGLPPLGNPSGGLPVLSKQCGGRRLRCTRRRRLGPVALCRCSDRSESKLSLPRITLQDGAGKVERSWYGL